MLISINYFVALKKYFSFQLFQFKACAGHKTEVLLNGFNQGPWNRFQEPSFSAYLFITTLAVVILFSFNYRGSFLFYFILF